MSDSEAYQRRTVIVRIAEQQREKKGKKSDPLDLTKAKQLYDKLEKNDPDKLNKLIAEIPQEPS